MIQISGSFCSILTIPCLVLRLSLALLWSKLVVLFENESGGYDARKGFKDGDSLLHPAGVGRGGDREIYKLFVVKAIVRYILQKKLSALKVIDGARYERIMAMDDERRRSRIDGYVNKMYAMQFDTKYEHDQDVKYNVEKSVLRAVDAVLDQNVTLKRNGHYHALGMPMGIGYLLVECKESPRIPKPQYNSTFGKLQRVNYGLGVADLVTESNAYLRSLNDKGIRSML